jgi:hypothetical protein
MSNLPDWVCVECGQAFSWGIMHAHVDLDPLPAIYQMKTCEYCRREYNKAYYPPICEACGATLETGSAGVLHG